MKNRFFAKAKLQDSLVDSLSVYYRTRIKASVEKRSVGAAAAPIGKCSSSLLRSEIKKGNFSGQFLERVIFELSIGRLGERARSCGVAAPRRRKLEFGGGKEKREVSSEKRETGGEATKVCESGAGDARPEKRSSHGRLIDGGLKPVMGMGICIVDA